MIDLKPCPFCGGEARIEGGNILGAFWVECKNCFAATNCADTENDVAAAWNQRVDPIARALEDDLR